MNPWLLAARPRTLPAAIAPVAIGATLAWRDGAFSIFHASIALVFALLVQIGANYANDYYDFVKGADTEKRIGPTRAVAAGLVSPGQMRLATGIVFAAAFMVGLMLVPAGGWWLVFVGASAIICGVAYTGGPYPLGYNGWGEVFVIIFFGFVAVSMTYYVQAGLFTVESLLCGLAPGALATNLLVVNNYRDAATDAVAGKRTLVVRYGKTFGYIEFVVLHAAAVAVPIILAIRWGSVVMILPLLLLPWAVGIAAQLARASGREAFGKVLAQTAAYLLLFSILLSGAIILNAVLAH